MKGLILLDWDNTIVDEQVQINTPEFYQTIQSKIKEGWQIGLNSDTPLKRLRGWGKSLGLNGPIVAERGAVVWWSEEAPLVLSSTKDFFLDLRIKLIQEFTKTDGYCFYYGDSTNFINSVSEFKSNDNVLIALDAYRICSLGMFIRKIDADKLFLDDSLSKSICDLIKTQFSSDSEVYSFDLNLEHGYLCLNALDVNKSIGVKTLLQKWTMPPKVYMIGDSMSDYLDLPYVSQLAVGNASPDYKRVSSKIAQTNYARGCVELLDSI